MKKLFVSVFALLALFSCEDDKSEEFDNANGNVAHKLIQSISYTSNDSSVESQSATINYDSSNRVTSVSNDQGSANMIYNGQGELVNITSEGESDPLNIEEAYESPYNAFETGEVLEYDNNGNPTKIKFLEEDYNWYYDENGQYQEEYNTLEYIAEVTCDSKPNSLYYTLEAAGIIAVLDNINLNFGSVATPDLVKAKALLPVNNITNIVYKNEENKTLYTISVNYNYEGDYPNTATVTSVDDEGQTTIVNANYVYKN